MEKLSEELCVYGEEAFQFAKAYEAEVEKRIAELENLAARRLVQINTAVADCAVRDSKIKDLQSQLAWTPVSAGLPTEPGVYEFVTLTRKCALFNLDVDGQWWTHARGDGTAPENLLDDTYWRAYRRIELPEEK